MLISFWALLVMIMFCICFMISPRKQIENGVHLMILGCIYLLIVISMIAAIYMVVGIPISLINITISVFALDLFMVGHIIKKKDIQKLKWFKEDIFCLIACIAVIGAISIWRFGIRLQLVYSDIDASRYMQGAMQIVFDKNISGQYFTTLIQAMFVAICQCFLPQINYYKALILSHIFMQLIGMCMFYILTCTVNAKINRRWINLLITILFWGGFPLFNSTYGTFIQSLNGATIVMLLLYYTIRLQKDEINQIQGIIGLIIGGFGLLVCYPFFGLIISLVLLPEAIIWGKNNFSKLTLKIKIILASILLIVAVVGGIFAAQRIGNSIQTFITALQSDGLTYKSPYKDFILFIPVFIFYIGLLKKTEQKFKSVLRMILVTISFIIVWFILYINGYLSTYYYYRMYYILWMISWLMVVDLIRIGLDNNQVLILSAYAAFSICMVVISIVDLNQKLWNIKPELFMQEENGQAICPLYKASYEAVSSKANTTLTQQELQLYEYVIENLSDSKVYMVHSVYTAMQAEWYIGITYNGYENKNGERSLETATLEKILVDLDGNSVDYVLISKSDPICMKYFDRVFSKGNMICENDSGYIIKKDTENWTDLIYDLKELDNGLFMMFSYISNNYDMESVPIVCEAEYENIAFEYGMYTGESATKYVGKITPENFMVSTYIFNNDQVEYMLILKDSKMYQYNKEYFDSQRIVAETDVGMIIQHAGNGWMPSEQ